MVYLFKYTILLKSSKSLSDTHTYMIEYIKIDRYILFKKMRKMTQTINKICIFFGLENYEQIIKEAFDKVLGSDFLDKVNPGEIPDYCFDSNGVVCTNTDNIFISLSGFAGSGKSTMASEFKKYGFEEISYASTLKDFISWLCSLPRDMVEGATPESRKWREEIQPQLGYSVRELLQLVGTNIFRRYISEDFWIRLQKKNLKGRKICSDSRFLNELIFMEENNAIIIRILGNEPDNLDILHPSETEHLKFRNWTHVWKNTFIMEDLQSFVESVLITANSSSF